MTIPGGGGGGAQGCAIYIYIYYSVLYRWEEDLGGKSCASYLPGGDLMTHLMRKDALR